MPNTYFQFKQFRIEQSNAAMKVCTESCILGAYAQHPNPARILDIGTGTGLLSLMLAQKYPKAEIIALEPHQPSNYQAAYNFENSPWAANINLLPTRLQDYLYNTSGNFDLIICNPPFYPGQRQKPKLNQAAHSFKLPASEIIKAINRLLLPTGFAFILYPPSQSSVLQAMAKKADLRLKEKLHVKNNEMVSFFRIINVLDKQSSSTLEKEFVIRDNGNYSPEFVKLMKDYYLFL